MSVKDFALPETDVNRTFWKQVVTFFVLFMSGFDQFIGNHGNA